MGEDGVGGTEGAAKGGPVAARSVELLGDVAVALRATRMFENRSAVFSQRTDPARIIPDAVVDVVSVFLLVAALQSMTFHGEQGGNRTDRDLDAVSTAGRHRPINRD